MHVFIDESGTFAVPKVPAPSISCAGALTLPSAHLDEIYAGFLAIGAEWPKEHSGEIKGRLLNAPEMDVALRYFASVGAVFECVAVDAGLHKTPEILEHRERQALNLARHLTERHRPEMVAEIHRLQTAMRAISAQEYLQTVAMTTLLDQILRKQLIYFSQAAPKEIGSFDWIIDRKQANRTRTEKLWNTLFLPFLEGRSLTDPMPVLIEGDYSAFDIKYSKTQDAPAPHLRAHSKHWRPGEPYHTTDIKAVFSSRRFADSANEIGLQMVDVATSAARRAMQGNIAREGWQSLGLLLLRSFGGQEAAKMIRLNNHDRGWKSAPPYYAVARELTAAARSVILGD